MGLSAATQLALAYALGVNGTAEAAEIAALIGGNSQFILNAGAGPLVASPGDLTGAAEVVAQYSGINGSTLTTRTATQMFADVPTASVNESYDLRILNTGGGNLTLTQGTGVTVAGKQVIPANTYTDYIVTFTSTSTMTFQSVGSGTAP